MDQIFKIGQKGMDESTDTMGDLYQELSLDQVDLKYLQEDDSSRTAPDGVLTGAGTRVPAHPASLSSPQSSTSATPVQQYVRRAGGGGGGGRRTPASAASSRRTVDSSTGRGGWR
uniref:Uncharacterized protein n=2 Tax=Heterosigma akashiwo TaxID=2829 RepID=A0A7S3XPX6_HETAK